MHNMDESTIKELAVAWVNLQQAKREDLDTDPYFWAHQKLWELSQESPDEAWAVILLIVKNHPNNFILGNVAAGPLEDLLCFSGESVIARVERHARNDSVFRSVLTGVWQNSMSDELWCRVQAAAYPTEH